MSARPQTGRLVHPHFPPLPLLYRGRGDPGHLPRCHPGQGKGGPVWRGPRAGLLWVDSGGDLRALQLLPRHDQHRSTYGQPPGTCVRSADRHVQILTPRSVDWLEPRLQRTLTIYYTCILIKTGYFSGETALSHSYLAAYHKLIGYNELRLQQFLQNRSFLAICSKLKSVSNELELFLFAKSWSDTAEVKLYSTTPFILQVCHFRMSSEPWRQHQQRQ